MWKTLKIMKVSKRYSNVFKQMTTSGSTNIDVFNIFYWRTRISINWISSCFDNFQQTNTSFIQPLVKPKKTLSSEKLFLSSYSLFLKINDFGTCNFLFKSSLTTCFANHCKFYWFSTINYVFSMSAQRACKTYKKDIKTRKNRFP